MIRSGVTFVATDIEGSTALNARLGDTGWLDVLRTHNAVVREQVARHGGRELKFLGDGFLLTFDSAPAAVECAVGVQRALARADAGVRIRIAVHTGRAWFADGDALGLDVTVTHRLMSSACGGEIVLSAAAHQALVAAGRDGTDVGRWVRPKGLWPQRTFRVEWAAPDAVVARGCRVRRGALAVLGGTAAALGAVRPRPALAREHTRPT